VIDWLKFNDDELSDYLNRDLEYTDKGQIKSNTTNIITVLVNPLFCKEEQIIYGTIFFDTCSMTVRFLGTLKGEKQEENEIRKWNDHLTNLLGVEIEREFGIKYSKNRMDDAITFIAHKRAINLPAMHMKSLAYDGESHISKLLPKYLGAEDTKLNAWIMEHMLVGMVKRVFSLGCKFDELMVLTGIQGIGKTSFIEKLALFPEWYCSLNNIKGKDAVSNLVGKVVVKLEEFVALRNAKSADEAKLFISARTSTVRLPTKDFLLM
jgi:predicted P-loop ATPase